MKTFNIVPFILLIVLSGCQFIIEDIYTSADRLVGSYEVDEWSETLGSQTYFDIFIHTDRYSPDIIYINNFYNAGIEVFAEVNGSKIRIPLQTAGPYEIEGFGSYDNGELTIDYSVFDLYSHTGFTDYCNAICLKY